MLDHSGICGTGGTGYGTGGIGGTDREFTVEGLETSAELVERWRQPPESMAVLRSRQLHPRSVAQKPLNYEQRLVVFLVGALLGMWRESRSRDVITRCAVVPQCGEGSHLRQSMCSITIMPCVGHKRVKKPV